MRACWICRRLSPQTLRTHTPCPLCCSQRTKQHATPTEISSVRKACHALLQEDGTAGGEVQPARLPCPARLLGAGRAAAGRVAFGVLKRATY